MISPEDVCANIERVKDSEKLSHCLDRVDFKHINENSHGLIIKSGIYKGSTLLLCALTKAKWNLIKKLIEKANANTIDVYASLQDTELTVISFIPDYLMCDLIQKAKEIKVNSNWRSKKGLLYDVIMGKDQDILYALLSKGLVDLELFENYKNNDQLKEYIRDIINKYLNAIRQIGMLPHAGTFNTLMDLLSKNEWLFDARNPNSRDVTFKEQIINRLKLVSQKQLREFYNRFPQYKPADFQIEEKASAPPTALQSAASAETPPPQLQQNGIEHKKELSLAELLYQGKHEILIERLQKGEIAFELFDPFVTEAHENALINYNCKNVIEVCLNWRAANFELPTPNAFQNILELFANNEWLFMVLDISSKKSLLELTRNKLRIKPQQLKQFNEKFPNCDAFLNQNTASKLPSSDKENPTNGSAKKDDEFKTSADSSSELRGSAAEISNGTATPPQSVQSHVADVTAAGEIPVTHTNGFVLSEKLDAAPLVASLDLTASTDQPVKNIPKENDESVRDNNQKLEPVGGLKTPVATVSGAMPTISSADAHESKNNVPLAQQMRALLQNFDEAEYQGESALGILAHNYRETERKKAQAEAFYQQQVEEAARAELLRKKQEEDELARLNAQENLQPQTSAATTSQQNSGGAAKAPASEPVASNPLKKDLQAFFVEQKNVLQEEIYNHEISKHENKKLNIKKVKEIFSNLYGAYKDDHKEINQNNRHDLLDVLCEFYRNISEEDHKKKINIHSNPSYDRFFRKPNTNSWQEMVKEIRKISLDYLLAVAAEQFKFHPDKTVTFLNSYVNEPLFCEHRSNVAICRIGDTNAVKQIKDVMAEYTDAIRVAKRSP